MKPLKVLLIVDSLVMVVLVLLFCFHPKSLALLSAAGVLAGLNAILTRFAFEFRSRAANTSLLAAGLVVAILSAALTLGSLG